MTLDILVVDELLVGKCIARILNNQGYYADFYETPAQVAQVFPQKEYDLLIIEPFEYQSSRGLSQRKDYAQFIRNFKGKVYLTTTQLEEWIQKDFGLEIGQDYSRFYGKPYNTIQLTNDIAIDFNHPQNFLNLNRR